MAAATLGRQEWWKGRLAEDGSEGTKTSSNYRNLKYFSITLAPPTFLRMNVQLC